MAKKLYEEASVQAIADAIRAKAGTADTYKIAEMPDAIASIPSGGGATEPYIEETYDSDGNLIEAKVYGYTKIRKNAFYFCDKLSTVNFPPELKSIGSSSFYGCAITNDSLPDGITDIGGHAFYSSKVTLSRLPNALTKIGAYAFGYCYNLSMTTLPAQLRTIEDAAFVYCKFKSMTFMGTPESIASNAFVYCTNLTTINVPWAEGAVANAPWGATNATINYNYTEG